jgi:hypothetical protein
MPYVKKEVAAYIKNTPPKKLDVQKMIKDKADNPKLKLSQLAAIHGCSVSNVSQLFKRYGVSLETIEEFKTNRADIFAGIQEIVARSLTEEDIKKAGVRDRTILLGTLYDKERLERGLSTQNSAVIMASAVIEASKPEGEPSL